MRKENGVATLFVIISGLFFIAFIMSILMLASAKKQTQFDLKEETQDIYAQSNQNALNNQTENVVPIYSAEQLLKIGSGEKIAITEENGRTYVFLETAQYVLGKNIEMEYNGTLDLEKYRFDTAGHEVKIKDTSKAEEIYYYYKGNYGYPVTEEGFKYGGIILRYDGTNNIGNGHSNTVTTWHDISGNRKTWNIKWLYMVKQCNKIRWSR